MPRASSPVTERSMRMHSTSMYEKEQPLATPTVAPGDERWLALQSAWAAHMMKRCGCQRGLWCCGQWLAVTTLPVVCPTCGKKYLQSAPN